MIVMNEIKGEGNSKQQDRIGSAAKVATDGTSTRLLWAADGHGSRISFTIMDLGGIAAETASKTLTDLSGDDIQRLYTTPEYGKKIFKTIQIKI